MGEAGEKSRGSSRDSVGSVEQLWERSSLILSSVADHLLQKVRIVYADSGNTSIILPYVGH